MQTLTFFFALPPLIYLAVCALWFVNKGLVRPLAILPIASCFGICGFMLIAGGCHRTAHVQLLGWESDLTTADGNPRSLTLGATPEDGAEPALRIPGYPEDALRLRAENGLLRLSPGSGYDRSMAVFNDEELVMLEQGFPRLAHLENGDSILIGRSAGASGLRHFTLGGADAHLTPPGQEFRVVGGSGAGAARAAGYPPAVFAIKKEGDQILVRREAGMTKQTVLLANQQLLDFKESNQVALPYDPGKTTLTLLRQEPMAGSAQLWHGPFANNTASLTWISTLADKPDSFVRRVRLHPDRPLSVGGSANDDVFVKGAPAEALQLVATADGRLRLELTEFGEEAQAKHEIHGQYPQEAGPGENIRLEPERSPSGGVFYFVRKVALQDAPVVSEAPSGDDETVELSGEAPFQAPDPEFYLEVAWAPNLQTQWQLPNRRITIPLANFEVPVPVRRPWRQKVYPLNALGPMEGGLRSCLLYGMGHPSINAPSLLLMDPAIAIQRNGERLKLTYKPGDVGLLANDTPIKFRQLLSIDETGGSASQTSVGEVSTVKRMVTQERFAALNLHHRKLRGRSIPYVELLYHKPEVQAIPMSEIYRAEQPDGDNKVAFGVNERPGFSNLPHQVKFRTVTDWFRGANASIDLRMFSIDAQDDYRSQEIDYGEEFTIGDTERLKLRIVKQTVPWGAIRTVGVAAVIVLVLSWGLVSQFGWASLLFGAVYLTCCRVLFGQGALVNLPYDESVLSVAKLAILAVPIAVAGGGWLSRLVLPGKLQRFLGQFYDGKPYRTLLGWTLLLLLLRIALLYFGMKESVELGYRLAFSIVFVPAYLIVFGLGCANLFWERSQAGEFRFDLVLRFIGFAGAVFMAQALSGLLVSDLGLFLYLIAQALVLAAIGAAIAIEQVLTALRRERAEDQHKPWHSAGVAGLMIVPLIMIAIVFVSPRSYVSSIPGLSEKLSSETDIATDSTMLRLLQFVDRDYLINLGTDTGERIAQDHAIMENYARRGLTGEGYLQVRVISAKRVTALNDNVSAIYIFAQFGVLGAISIAIAYLAITLAAGQGALRRTGAFGWVGLLAGLSFSVVSIYMMASNYGLVPFTGRNMYLLGLDSGSDILESLTLLGLVMLSLAIQTPSDSQSKEPESNSAEA